ncbi:MAG: hypothetical protein HOG89_02945 [Candidatus Peribacter sp.]|jgi:hypothetical protein|nr:hypothetical protein [Candidatus Peribacter sp.]MBT4392685.1 hypothetical protein [Candidatus Peribacter sp.]MBT4600698.1 hypothetical protein [Candidatus Peribacter sp.]MBT5148633.1 hypothetical protein [Candidatus Peribacter sp.]MBT5637772.1 hypothetical protein [Candidatus Peribacter sp.]
MIGKKKEPESKSLVKTMKSLDKHMEMLASHYQPKRYLWMGFIRGIVYGLGIIVSIAIVLPFLLAILSTIDWIPYVGDLISEIVFRMESAQRPY